MNKDIELKPNELQEESLLFQDVCEIIDGARKRVATYVNTEVCLTNWYVGKHIKEDVLFNRRAEYDQQIVKNMSIRLVNRYGNGWGEKKLRYCLRAAYTFSENEMSTIAA